MKDKVGSRKNYLFRNWRNFYKQNSSVADHLIIPHGSYLLNLGSPKEDVREKSLT